MSKTKKSKLLASMLCASVVAGLYAGPVMAGNATYDANSSGITINIDTERTGDGDGIFIKNGLDWNSTYKATGKITISTANLVTALNGSSFETLTIGGQAINSTTIGDFKTDYSALKAKVDALDTTDLTGRVDALESKVGVQNGQVVLKNGGNVGVLVGTGTTAVAAGGSKIALNKADNTVVTSVNGMEVIKTNVDGTTFKTTREEDGVTSINGGTITAGKDVVAGVTSLVTVGEKTTALENKTTAIEYTPGDPDGIGSQKLGTTTIKDKLNADIFSANQGTIGGVTMAGGAISTGAFAVDNSGNITAGTVNGVDVVNVGEKTTAIEYTPGDPDGIGSQKLGTTTIKDKLNADIFSANQGTIGGVTLAGGAINAGAFAVDNSGNITANNLVTNKYDVNATFDELTDKMGNVSTITVIEDTPKGTITDVASHLNVQGDITANGDVITRDGASLNGLHDQVEKDALNIHNLQVNTTDIKYADGVTEIGKGALVVNNEGYVTINNGMLTADAESGYVTMGKNIEFDTASGNITANNVYSKNYNLETIGDQLNELETGVGTDISDLKRKTTDIEYADGVTNVSGVEFKDGTITAANGNFSVSKSGVVSAHAVNADVIMFEGGSIMSTGIRAIDGKFIVDAEGNVKAAGDVTSTNYSLEAVGDQMKNVEGITRENGVTDIEGVAQFGNGSVKVNGAMQVAGDKFVYSYQDEEGNMRVGSLKTIDTSIDALEDKTTDIKYADGVTEIGKGALVVNNEGYVTINNGMLTVDAESGYVTMGNKIEFDTASGNITANNVYSKNYNLETIGDQLNELETGVGEDITDLKRKTTDIEYADGVTTIAGATKFTENGMQVGTTVINKDGSIGAADGNFTVTADGEVIVRGENGATSITGDAITIGDTVIKDGMITTHKAEIGGVEIANGRVDGVDVSELAGSVFDGSKDIAELQRITTGMDYQNGVTSFSGDITFRHNGDTVSLGGLVDKVNDIYDRTSGISKDENGNTVIDGGLVVDGDTTGTGGSITGNGDMNISGDGQIGGDLDVAGSVNAGNVNTGNINAGKGTIGGIHMENGEMTVGDTTVNGDGVNVGGENGTSITDKDVVINKGTDNEVSLSDVGNRVDNLEQGMASMSNRISKVEDRIDKVGAMSAAIANLRTMGYDPTAPTEIAVGIGQYRSETGAALGLFHYPNKDFMLSLSVSTSGDEVMGGIGATWKFGRKSPEQMLAAEKEKAAKAKLAKAEAMKKAAAEAKVAAQQAKHAKMAAEKAAK